MRELTLSDHAGEQGSLAAAKRRKDFDASERLFSAAMAGRRQKSGALQKKSQAAFRERRYFAWLVSFFPRMAHAFSSKPPKPKMAAAGRDEVVWNAGGAGEQRVTDALAGFLSDDWTLVSGYRNTGGEIDKLLVGPAGVLAMEIKFVNGKVFCRGDKWWRDKYDNYGNLVETGVPIADKRGRGPSAQVNDAADRLQSFLSMRSSVRRVARAVVLSHESSQIGEISGQKVDLVATLGQLNVATLAKAMPGGPAGALTDQIVALIRKDHEFHMRPREERQANRRRHAAGSALAGS